MRLSIAWTIEIQDQINKSLVEHIPFKYTTAEPTAKRYIVLQLVRKSIPYRVINNGCGVSTITTETDTCSKCNGTGKV